MTALARWPIAFTCGHVEHRALLGKPPGYATWLAARECSRCWHARIAGVRVPRRRWLATRRTTQLAELAAWEAANRMPPLRGSPAAVTWGRACRRALVDAGRQVLLATSRDDNACGALDAAARRILSAGWWIDHRGSDPAHALALIRTAARSRRPRRRTA